MSLIFNIKKDSNININNLHKANSFTLDISKKLSNISLSSCNSESSNEILPSVECVVTNEKEKKFAEQLKKSFNYEKAVKYVIKQTKSKNKSFEVRLIVNGEKTNILKKYNDNDETMNTTLKSIYDILNKKYV